MAITQIPRKFKLLLNNRCLSESKFLWSSNFCDLNTLFYILSSRKYHTNFKKILSYKNVFPVIERYRRNFITDNYDQLRIILQNEDSEPYDLDIGNIKYLIQSGTLNMELQKQKELEFFHKSRNKIAHSNIISYNDVKKILNRYSKSN